MKQPAAALLYALLVLAPAAGQPMQLYGMIGRTPVFFDLSRDGDTVSGWYFPLKTAEQVRLQGKLDAKGLFQIDAFTGNTNSRLGSFTGRLKDGHWRGSWHDGAGGKAQPIAFDELRSKPSEIDGRYRCSGVRRDPEFAITVTQIIDVKIVRGRVKSFSLGRAQRSDGEELTCRIAPGIMRQVPAPVGILLRARADRADGSQHCTVRLYRAGNYLVVKPGNPSQLGDDCRGAGGTHFCSTGGFWSDLVLDRKTQACRPVK